MLLAGASDAGLADPGHSTAISLTLASVALLPFVQIWTHLLSANACSNYAMTLAKRSWQLTTVWKKRWRPHLPFDRDRIPRRDQARLNECQKAQPKPKYGELFDAIA